MMLTVKLTNGAHDCGWMADSRHPLLVGTRHLIPHAERTRSQRTVVNRSEQVAPNPKEVLNKAVYRKKPLRVRGGRETAHLSLALSRGGDQPAKKAPAPPPSEEGARA